MFLVKKILIIVKAFKHHTTDDRFGTPKDLS